jgi:hypothetical protein
MYRKGEAGAIADALDEPVDGVGRERAAALGGEDEGRVRELPAQFAQRSHLVAAQRMRRGLAILGAGTCSVALRPSSTWIELLVPGAIERMIPRALRDPSAKQVAEPALPGGAFGARRHFL